MIIYLEDKRREMAGWVQKLQHLIAGVPLFLVGLSKLTGEEAERPIAILELAVALGVFTAFAVELRAARRHAASGGHAHSPVGWFDLAAGALLIFEAFHSPHVKPGYLRPQFLSGILTLIIGLSHGRLHSFHRRRHYLKLDDAGMEFRRAPFRRLTVPWTDLASVDLRKNEAILHRKDGRRHKIRLGRYRNIKALRQGLADHARAAGLLLE
jgi:uncharacterized membrane protein HdeD (DUF308 family)